MPADERVGADSLEVDQCPHCEGFGYGVEATDGTFIVPGDDPCRVCGGEGTVVRSDQRALVRALREQFEMIRSMALTDGGVGTALELILTTTAEHESGRVILRGVLEPQGIDGSENGS